MTSPSPSSPAKPPGLLFVGARITNPALPYPTFARWYDEMHMPHLASMSGIRAAMRYVRAAPPADAHPDASSAMPYVTLYPLHDVGWLQGTEFDAMRESTEADYLPGRSVFKSVEMDGRGYEVVEGGAEGVAGGEGKGATKFILFTTYDPSKGDSASADATCVEKYYAAQAKLPGCKGMTRYRYCEVQRPEMAAKFEASGQWPAKDLVIHGLDVPKMDLEAVYQARDEAAGKLSEPSRLEVVVYELVTGLDG